MSPTYYFPFGQPLLKVEQADKSPKKIFILGVYASAVHARWIDPDGKQIVSALAVASEPEIFWTGHDAEEIISKIRIPGKLGELTVPTNKGRNGPSGIALDKYYLGPLGLKRTDVWLCDLLPYSRVNAKQRTALDKHYTDAIIRRCGLRPANIPDFSKSEVDDVRMDEIYQELIASGAKTIITLGDEPISKFIGYLVKEKNARGLYKKKYSRLSGFGNTEIEYGKEHEIEIRGTKYKLIPLCHPRQAAKLGNYSKVWNDLHMSWIKSNKIKL
ncbi:MAG: hypothetical protein JXB49_18285 [Bacteroidales bacterium]|nr:hypothetical protein [Bacteroidales bacterium]